MARQARFDNPDLDKIDLAAHAHAVLAGTTTMRADARTRMLQAFHRRNAGEAAAWFRINERYPELCGGGRGTIESNDKLCAQGYLDLQRGEH